MTNTSYIKCLNCGIFNTNKEYCENCGELISYKKKQELRVEKAKQEELAEAIKDVENLNLPQRLKKHSNFFVRIIGWILYSVWLVVSLIGAFLAWAIAMVAAG